MTVIQLTWEVHRAAAPPQPLHTHPELNSLQPHVPRDQAQADTVYSEQVKKEGAILQAQQVAGSPRVGHTPREPHRAFPEHHRSPRLLEVLGPVWAQDTQVAVGSGSAQCHGSSKDSAHILELLVTMGEPKNKLLCWHRAPGPFQNLLLVFHLPPSPAGEIWPMATALCFV